MKKITLFIIIAASLYTAPGSGKGTDQIDIPGLRSHIEFLASPELEGREAPYRGSEITARYIATRFQEYGLQHIDGCHDYYQQVPLLVMTPDYENTSITLNKNEEEIKFITDEELFFFPKGGNNEMFTAPVVLCGYGITAPEYNYDDYQNIDVKGKIVMVMNREPQEADSTSVFNGAKGTKYSIPMVKARIAAQNGARALLIIQPPEKEPIEESLTRYRDKMDKPIVQLAGKTESLPVFYFTAGAAEKIMSGIVNLPDYFAGIETELKPDPMELDGLSLSIDIRFRERFETESPNVIGWLEGSDSKLRDQYLIIGAHYDHEGFDGEGNYYPGADDNASGVAALLELAESYSSLKKKPRQSILFISFAAEEKGTLGSLYYSLNPLLPPENAIAMFNMDEVGRNGAMSYRGLHNRELAEKGKNSVMLFYSAQTPRLEEVNEKVNRKLGLEIYFDPNTRFHGNSDHVHFHDLQIPSIFYFTGFHPDYTSPNDTPDKINYEKMERIVRLIYGAGEIFLNSREKPVFDTSIKEVKKKKSVMSF